MLGKTMHIGRLFIMSQRLLNESLKSCGTYNVTKMLATSLNWEITLETER